MKTNLKILLLASFTFVMATNLSAQKNCKFDINEKDPFSGETIKGTTTTIMNAPYGPEGWYIGLNKVGEKFHIGMLLQDRGEFNTYLNEGDSIMFKFENNEILTIYANEQVSPKSDAGVYNGQPMVVTQYKCNYDISPENMKKFTQSSVTFIRMNIGDKHYENELKKKRAKDLIQDAACIMK